MAKLIKTYDDLIEAAGGSLELAHSLGLKSQDAVLVWKYRGIPGKYWGHLIRKYGVKADTLCTISEKARVKKITR